MSANFSKFHLNADGEEGWKIRPALHRFTGPDLGEPHDHPWGFTSHILSGGYIEEIYHRNSGGWWIERVERFPKTAHTVQATCIHRIIALLEPECWTLVMATGDKEREPRFWRFDGQHPKSRAWNETWD